MTTKKRDTSYGRILYAVIGVAVSLLLAYFFSDRLKNGADIISYVATVFSILAGVVIAVVSILGEPSMIAESSWRKDFLAARETQRKIHRHTDLFVVYIILLATLFLFSLTDPSDKIYRYTQFASFALICLSFWMSLSLPYSLKHIQKKRMDNAIDAKRTAKSTTNQHDATGK